MTQNSKYVGLLPEVFVVEKARVIGDQTIGQVLQIPTNSDKVPLSNIGDLAQHFAQSVLKITGESHTVDGFDPAIYKIQNESGRVNYVLRVRLGKGGDGEPKQVAVIQPDTGCTHTGVLRAYLQEIAPEPE